MALLKAAGFDAKVVGPPIDEPSLEHAPFVGRKREGEESATSASPAELAQALAYFKARCVADLVREGVVLAGDTVVSLAGRLFGKPVDRNDAERILQALQGTVHQVITGVALVDARSGKRQLAHASSDVTMAKIPAKKLQDYLNTNAWQGKAGAFGVQDRDDPLVERIDGSFTNVVGMPMELVTSMLSEWGIKPKHCG
jgi:septum formation protein